MQSDNSLIKRTWKMTLKKVSGKSARNKEKVLFKLYKRKYMFKSGHIIFLSPSFFFINQAPFFPIVSLTPSNTKTIGRMTCHCFLRPIRRDLTSSSYTTLFFRLGRLESNFARFIQNCMYKSLFKRVN